MIKFAVDIITMEFNPHNNIVKRCLQGMALEEKNDHEEAGKIFMLAWNEAENDFEKFLAAYYLARHQKNPQEKLNWFQTSLGFALGINDDSVNSAFPSLYSNIAACYEQLNDEENAEKNRQLSIASQYRLSDKGPFYHGTKANLKPGDLLTAGFMSNYDVKIKMNHIYFTAIINGAGLAAELAAGEGNPHVYQVEPTGSFENDPNVTDKKFPGNPTRSYRSTSPLKIISEVKDWTRMTPEQLKQWREKLANTKGEIIN